MALTVPSWFKGRQGKAEEAGPNTYKLTAPNVRDAFVSVRRADNGRYVASLRLEPDGPEVDRSTAALEDEYDAWELAFEMYRKLLIL